jgi:hypothetical protein
MDKNNNTNNMNCVTQEAFMLILKQLNNKQKLPYDAFQRT